MKGRKLKQVRPMLLVRVLALHLPLIQAQLSIPARRVFRVPYLVGIR